MKAVSKTEFFAAVGPLDVNPRVDVASLKRRFHVSSWEDRNRKVIGRSESDSYGVLPTQFFLQDGAL